jgi:hypothetical protein
LTDISNRVSLNRKLKISITIINAPKAKKATVSPCSFSKSLAVAFIAFSIGQSGHSPLFFNRTTEVLYILRQKNNAL